MRIFICHATEDKADFVRPLAQALKQHFEVWYDEYELTLGDSLLKKINEGLASCNYGAVVLSNSFFLKKWPQAELDGLFALEGTTRKMILPIWKGVTVEDVKKFSPILAGRLGANASEGVEKVVSEIRRAIEVSNRTREISATDSVIQKARQLDQTLQERSNHERLSRSSEEGVAIVNAGFANLCTAMQSQRDSINQSRVSPSRTGNPRSAAVVEDPAAAHPLRRKISESIMRFLIPPAATGVAHTVALRPNPNWLPRRTPFVLTGFLSTEKRHCIFFGVPHNSASKI